MEINKTSHFIAGILIGLGLMVTGAVISNSSPELTSSFKQTLTVFDVHQQFETDLAMLHFVVMEAPQDFLEEFYIAFTQVMTVPADKVEAAIKIPKLAQDGLMGILEVVPIEAAGQVSGESISSEQEFPYQYESIEINTPNILRSIGY